MLIDSPYSTRWETAVSRNKSTFCTTPKTTVSWRSDVLTCTCSEHRLVSPSTRLYLWQRLTSWRIAPNYDEQRSKKGEERRSRLARLEGWKNSCGEAKQRRVMESRILVPRPPTKTCNKATVPSTNTARAEEKMELKHCSECTKTARISGWDGKDLKR